MLQRYLQIATNLLLATSLCGGCVSSGAQSTGSATKKQSKSLFFDQNALGLSRNDVTSNIPYSPSVNLIEDNQKIASQTKTPQRLRQSVGTKSTMREQCLAAIQQWLPPWQEMLPNLRAKSKAALPRETLLTLSGKLKPACDNVKQRNDVIAVLAPLLSQHKNKVGLIAPVSGSQAQVGKNLLTGIQLALGEKGIDPTTSIVVADTEEWMNAAAMTMAKDKLAKLDEQLMNLLIGEGVSIIIAATDLPSEQHLITRAKSLDFPLMLLANGGPDSDMRGAPVFRVVPNISTMGQALAAAAVGRGFKKVAVFKPADGRADAMNTAFVKAFVGLGGSVGFLGSFTSGNFESKDTIVQEAFKINSPERREEHELLYQQMKLAATERGESFNPKLAILPPVIDFDAIFLPDDFRSVRHFAKILRYHGVKQMPLLGHQGWRSQGLLEPYDRFLEGSIFVDYVGSYGELPVSLNAAAYTDTANTWFLAPEFSSTLDYQLIGYRAGSLSTPILLSQKSKRRKFAEFLRKAPNKQVGFFAGRSNFDEQQHSVWPAFIFTLKEGTLSVQSATPTYQSRAQQSAALETKSAEQGIH